MDTKKFIITGVVVAVVYAILSFIMHGVILQGCYEATASIWRTMEDMNQKMWIMYVNYLIWAFLFVFIFTKGYEARGWLEGLRFGLLIGLFVSIPMSLGTYATSPIPFSLAIYWFLLGMVQIIICGIITALIYKPAKK